jgi:hypothetical protein
MGTLTRRQTPTDLRSMTLMLFTNSMMSTVLPAAPEQTNYRLT